MTSLEQNALMFKYVSCKGQILAIFPQIYGEQIFICINATITIYINVSIFSIKFCNIHFTCVIVLILELLKVEKDKYFIL